MPFRPVFSRVTFGSRDTRRTVSAVSARWTLTALDVTSVDDRPVVQLDQQLASGRYKSGLDISHGLKNSLIGSV